MRGGPNNCEKQATCQAPCAGVDTVTLDSDAVIEKDARARLGAGNDTFTHRGDVNRRMSVDGGSGSDTFFAAGGVPVDPILKSFETIV